MAIRGLRSLTKAPLSVRGKSNHYATLPPIHGLSIGTPSGPKSLALRVASVRSWTRAVAAKNPSIAESATPPLRACAIRSPQRSATAGSIGRMRPAKRAGKIIREPGGKRRAPPAFLHQGDAAPKLGNRSDADEGPVLVEPVEPGQNL